MNFKNHFLFLAIAMISFSLFTGCQKNHTEDTLILSEKEAIQGLHEVTLDEIAAMGVEINETFNVDPNAVDVPLDENTATFRNHRPVIDPCTEGSPVFRMDIENFTLGADINTQSPRFQLFNPNNNHDGFVMPEYNNQFVFWETERFDYGIENDAHTLLDLDARNSGRYVLGFNLKVLPHSTAYFDVRRVLAANRADDEIAAKVWLYSNDIGIIRVGRRYYQFYYPQNTWMDIHIDFDLNNNVMRFYMNKELSGAFPIAAYPNAVGQTVQIEAVSFSTELRQSVINSGIYYTGAFKADNFCFSRVSN